MANQTTSTPGQAYGNDFIIEWNFCGSPIKSATYNSLNKDASQNEASTGISSSQALRMKIEAKDKG